MSAFSLDPKLQRQGMCEKKSESENSHQEVDTKSLQINVFYMFCNRFLLDIHIY